MFELLCIMYLSFNHILEVMENTTYIDKCFEFDVVTYILTFAKRVLYLTLRKNRVLLKKGCFIGRQNQRFCLKQGCFFRPKSAKRGCFSNLGTSMVYALVGSRGPRWRHQMETFSAWLAICAGNSPVTGEFSTQRPVTQSFDVFFNLRLNKQLSKHVCKETSKHSWPCMKRIRWCSFSGIANIFHVLCCISLFWCLNTNVLQGPW